MVAFKSLLLFALPMLSLASPLVERTDVCNSGSVQCCNTVTSSTDPVASALSGLLGIALGPIKGLVGMNCFLSPAYSCTQQAVCCTNNNFNGVVALGCTPINIGL